MLSTLRFFLFWSSDVCNDVHEQELNAKEIKSSKYAQVNKARKLMKKIKKTPFFGGWEGQSNNFKINKHRIISQEN